jgi:hypothetical protein
MQQNVNPYIYGQNPQQGVTGPNAVNINIIQPQAFASQGTQQIPAQNYYPLYQTNPNPALPLYPMNYNNMIQGPASVQNQIPPNGNQNNNGMNAYGDTHLLGKTPNGQTTPGNTTIIKEVEKSKDKKEEKPKKITLLTDNYIKSLENYLNDDNPKTRLVAAKEVMERFKEDDSRIDNPSLIPLLNKMLKDTSPSVRFLALTTLQLGYSIGNEETVELLKAIQKGNGDKLGEDSLLASEILLKLTAPTVTEVKK